MSEKTKKIIRGMLEEKPKNRLSCQDVIEMLEERRAESLLQRGRGHANVNVNINGNNNGVGSNSKKGIGMKDGLWLKEGLLRNGSR